MTKLDYFIAVRPLPSNKGGECGDTAVIKEFDNKLFIGIVDVAGHGKNAQKIAVICKDYLESNYRRDLVETMNGLHEHIKGSRGAVAGIGHLDLKTGELKYVGVGNIVLRRFGASSVKVIPRLGIVGYTIPTPREEVMKLHDGDVLVLYTDGVKEHFELADYPELLNDNAETIATLIIQQFGKEDDDAACIALRYKS